MAEKSEKNVTMILSQPPGYTVEAPGQRQPSGPTMQSSPTMQAPPTGQVQAPQTVQMQAPQAVQMQPPQSMAGAAPPGANMQPGAAQGYTGPNMAQPNQYQPQAYPQGGLAPQFTGGAYPQQPGAYPQGAYPQPPVGMVYNPAGAQPQMQQPWSQPVQPVGAPPMYHTAMPLMALTLGAAPVDCPVCRKRAITRTEFQAGSTTHLWALIWCFFTGLPCIPYLMNGTKNVKHSCGSCGVHLATWNRGGQTVVYQHA